MWIQHPSHYNIAYSTLVCNACCLHCKQKVTACTTYNVYVLHHIVQYVQTLCIIVNRWKLFRLTRHGTKVYSAINNEVIKLKQIWNIIFLYKYFFFTLFTYVLYSNLCFRRSLHKSAVTERSSQVHSLNSVLYTSCTVISVSTVATQFILQNQSCRLYRL